MQRRIARRLVPLIVALIVGFTGIGQAQTRLVYWTHTHDPAIPVNEELIASFKAMYPDVEVVYEHFSHSEYETKLLTAFASGAGPDVFWIGDWVLPQYFPAGIVDPVDPAAFGVRTQDEVEALFEPGVLSVFKHNGTLYTAGISEYNTFSILYNKRAFQEAGLPEPSTTEPLAWSEFVQAAQKLTLRDESGRRLRSGFETVWGNPIWTPLVLEPFVRQLGGGFVDESGRPQLDSEPVVQVFQAIQDLVFEYGASDPSFVIDLFDDFANERVAMAPGGPWAMFVKDVNPDLEVGVMPMPVMDGGQRVTILYAWAWFVNASSRNREMAWKLAAHLATSNPQLWWDKVSYIQPLKGRFDELVRQHEWMEAFVEDFKYGAYQFRSPAYYEIANILHRALSAVTNEQVDVRSTLQGAQREALATVR